METTGDRQGRRRSHLDLLGKGLELDLLLRLQPVTSNPGGARPRGGRTGGPSLRLGADAAKESAAAWAALRRSAGILGLS